MEKGQNELLDIAEILMRALEAGSTAGGDKDVENKKRQVHLSLLPGQTTKSPT